MKQGDLCNTAIIEQKNVLLNEIGTGDSPQIRKGYITCEDDHSPPAYCESSSQNQTGENLPIQLEEGNARIDACKKEKYTSFHLKENEDLQKRFKKLVADENRNQSHEKKVLLTSESEMKIRYERILPEITHLTQGIQNDESKIEMLKEKLKTKIQEKENRLTNIASNFNSLKMKLTQTSNCGKNSKCLPKKLVEDFTKVKIGKDTILEQERLRFIMFRSHVKKLELKIHKKGYLGNGLTLVDFEQLQVENKKLCKKINDGSREISKLKSKHESILTESNRCNQNLNLARERNIEIKEQANDIDIVLHEDRNLLRDLKNKLARIKKENEVLRENNTMKDSIMIAKDYCKTKSEIEMMQIHLSNLKACQSKLIHIMS